MSSEYIWKDIVLTLTEENFLLKSRVEFLERENDKLKEPVRKEIVECLTKQQSTNL